MPLPRYLPSVIHNAEHLLSEAVNLQSSVLEDEPRFCNIQHKENNNDCAIYPRKIDGTGPNLKKRLGAYLGD
jgi:hypothetical protein